MIAPAVLAMIETTTKGMLMTKLKLGALALAMLGGVVGSGVGLGVGRPVKATDEAGQVKAAGPTPAPASGEIRTNDLALIRIRPGQKLPASPIVRADSHPETGMKLVSVGCSQGRDATAVDTIISGEYEIVSGTAKKIERSLPFLACTPRPADGRGGGGLFTPSGDLAGVCRFIHTHLGDDNVGLSTGPEAIVRLLDRNNLAHLRRGEEAAGPAVEDDADSSTVQSATKAKPLRGRASVGTDPAPLPEPKSARSRLATDRDLAPDERPLLVPQPEPEPARLRPSTDQDRRIDDLERKLDRILKALESPKDVPPDAPGNPTNR